MNGNNNLNHGSTNSVALALSAISNSTSTSSSINGSTDSNTSKNAMINGGTLIVPLENGAGLSDGISRTVRRMSREPAAFPPAPAAIRRGVSAGAPAGLVATWVGPGGGAPASERDVSRGPLSNGSGRRLSWGPTSAGAPGRN